MTEADIRERVAAVINSWVDRIPERVSVELTNAHFWDLRPTSPQASPLWVAGSCAGDLTVGFGRRGSRIELGYSSKVTDQEALDCLDQIGRSVIAGRLTEWRRGHRGSRWELLLPDGNARTGRQTGSCPSDGAEQPKNTSTRTDCKDAHIGLRQSFHFPRQSGRSVADES